MKEPLVPIFTVSDCNHIITYDPSVRETFSKLVLEDIIKEQDEFDKKWMKKVRKLRAEDALL